LKFLLDVHIATSVARALETKSHDVLRAAFGYADWTDADLLALAVQEERIIVTEDRDFSDLIFRQGAKAPPSLLYLRLQPDEQPFMADRVTLVLENLHVDGHLVVIRSASFRLRPFPNSRV
jgi:predicted nuclease of predicted toxin-antitoxin system